MMFPYEMLVIIVETVIPIFRKFMELIRFGQFVDFMGSNLMVMKVKCF